MATIFALGSTYLSTHSSSKRTPHRTFLVFAGKKGVSKHKNETHQKDRRHPRKSGFMKSSASPGLITINKSDGDWEDSWTDEYVISFRELGLVDLVSPTDGSDNNVNVTLSVKKHAAMGYSVDGRVVSSLTRECINCCAKYTTELNASFNAWCIPMNRSFGHFREDGEVHDDPSVIYFTPGKEEANLDDFVRDTIRLNCSTEGTCSDACEKSELSKLESVLPGNGEKVRSVSNVWLPLFKANIN